MWTPLIFTLLVSAACSLNPLSQEFIDRINSLNSTWTAGRNFEDGVSMTYLRRLVGVHPDTQLYRLPVRKNPYVISGYAFPASFDARQQWPYCPSINEIYDQGDCASSWALAAVAAMTDRVCIQSSGKVNFNFSAEDLLSCCSDYCYGCSGGSPSNAWHYWINSGIVSGGPYNSSQGCRPYSIKPTGFDISMRSKGSNIYGKSNPACVRKCQPSYNVTYEQDLHYGHLAYSVFASEDAIKNEIMIGGPVEATYTIYDDFYTYRSGVYKYLYGNQVGKQSVKILGWGTEGNTPYWLVANSWSVNWGESGYFKILRGSNECQIESSVVAGLPRVQLS